MDWPVLKTLDARSKLVSNVAPKCSDDCAVTLALMPLNRILSLGDETRERVENPTRVSSAGIIAACKGLRVEISGSSAGLVAAGGPPGVGSAAAAVAGSAFCVKVAGAVGVGASGPFGVEVPGGGCAGVGRAPGAEACGFVGLAEVL